MRMKFSRITALAAVVIGMALPHLAEAYPQFQFSTGNSTCTPCHFSPVGGGLIADWGREENADSISQFGGDGGFLHGLWTPPEWLGLGIDIRTAALSRSNEVGDSESAVFPMQGDVYLRLAYKGISAYFASGACCSARDEDRADSDSGVRFFARNYQVMYQPESAAWYVRAGRFYTPFGLRHQDHTLYARRDHGQYLAEETLTVSGGYSGSDWDVHVGVFTPDFQVDTRERASGFSVLYENRLAADNGSWGGHAKLDIGEGSTKTTIGALGKYWLESPGILILAELDGILESFSDQGDARFGTLAHLNVSYFLTKGLMAGVTAELYDPDIKIADTERTGLSLGLQFFPYAHLEVHALGRLEIATGSQSTLGMLMLHYWL